MRQLAALRAESRARDAFLAKATDTLVASAAALERALRAQRFVPARVCAANTSLQELLRELRIIATPAAPIALRQVEVELCGTLAAFFAERKKLWHQQGLSLTLRRSAAVYCRVDVAHLATMLDEGCGADVQRRVHDEGGMEGLLEFLVTETARLDHDPRGAPQPA